MVLTLYMHVRLKNQHRLRILRSNTSGYSTTYAGVSSVFGVTNILSSHDCTHDHLPPYLRNSRTLSHEPSSTSIRKTNSNQAQRRALTHYKTSATELLLSPRTCIIPLYHAATTTPTSSCHTSSQRRPRPSSLSEYTRKSTCSQERGRRESGVPSSRRFWHQPDLRWKHRRGSLHMQRRGK